MKSLPGRFVLNALLLLVLSMMPALPLSAQSGNPPAFTPASIRFEDDVISVTVDGDNAYVGTYTKLYILDTTHPMNPRTTGSLDIPVLDAVIEDKMMYATSGSYLLVMDVTDSAFPQMLSMNRMPSGSHKAIALFDTHVYIGHNTGLAAINVSDPYSPTLVGNLEYVVGGVNGIEIREVVTDMGQRRYAYLATQRNRVWEGFYGGGLRIVDVTDPADMQQIYPCRSAICPTDCDMLDLAGEGDYIFTIQAIDHENDRLYIHDISDPDAIQEVAFHEMSQPAWHVAVQNNQAHVATGSALENFGSIQTFDVTDKANPRQVGLHGIEVNPINARLAASPACLFVPQGARGLKILCESTITPTPPSLVYMPMVQAAG